MSVRRFSVVGSLLALGLLAGSVVAVPAYAEGIDPSPPAITAALRAYGWQPEAVTYLVAHVRPVPAGGRLGGICPAAVACTTPSGVMFLNLVTDDQTTFNYVINHEMIHAMQFARGEREGVVGGLLADLLAMSTDTGYPLAAAAASRVLGLTGSEDYPVLDQQDWFHIDHDLLQDVGWDVANLPPWFRDTYFPYLHAAPAAATRPRQPSLAQPPGDLNRRVQRVVDTVLTMCGPSMPGAQLIGPRPPCGAAQTWSATPYPALGTTGAAPATVATDPTLEAAAVASAPLAEPLAPPQSGVGVTDSATSVEPAAGTA